MGRADEERRPRPSQIIWGGDRGAIINYEKAIWPGARTSAANAASAGSPAGTTTTRRPGRSPRRRRRRGARGCRRPCRRPRGLPPGRSRCPSLAWLGIPAETRLPACLPAAGCVLLPCRACTCGTHGSGPTHASRDSDRGGRVPTACTPKFVGSPFFTPSQPIKIFRSTKEGAAERPGPGLLLLLEVAAAAARGESERHPAPPNKGISFRFPRQGRAGQGSHAWSSGPRSGAAPAPVPIFLLRSRGVALAREARVRLPARRPRASGVRTAVGEGDAAGLPLRQVDRRAYASRGNRWPLQADHTRWVCDFLGVGVRFSSQWSNGCLAVLFMVNCWAS